MVAGPVTTGTANIFIENTNTTNIIYIYLDTLSTFIYVGSHHVVICEYYP